MDEDKKTQPPSTHVQVTSIDILREWFGGERYAGDHEYLDGNYGKQAQQVVDWLTAQSEGRLEVLARRHEKALQIGAKMREALEHIADEENVYKGHGNYETVPVLSAEEAQSAARSVLMSIRLESPDVTQPPPPKAAGDT
jgi:hypothetical protein